MAAPLMGVMSQVGGLIFGGQVGQALGTLATEVVELHRHRAAARAGRRRRAAARVDPRRSGDGLDVPLDEVRLFVALREAAHQRLFGHVPWLRGHLLAAVRAYAEGITVDTSRFEELAAGSRPERPRGDAAGDRRAACSSRRPHPRSRPRWAGSRRRSRSSRAGSTP